MHTSSDTASRFTTITKYLRQYRGYLVVGACAVVLANALILANPYVMKLIFDGLEKGLPRKQLLTYVGLIVVLALVAGIFRFLMRRTIIWMSRRLEYDLRNELFGHLLTCAPSFFDRTRTGDLMARATSDLEAVRMMIGPGMMQIANSFVTVIVALIFMIVLSPRLTLYAVLPMVILPFAVNVLGNLVHRKHTKVQEQLSLLTATAQENLAGVRVVKAYRQEADEVRNFARQASEYVRRNLELARVQGLLFPLVVFIAALLNLVVLYLGGLDVIAGRMPLGTVVAFFAYLNMLFWPMMAGGWVVSLYQQGTASLDRINAILRTPSEIADSPTATYEQPMQGHIEFRNLTFGYTDVTVLRDISLTLEPGETLGVIGPVGCGKSTLTALLTRQYPVPRGMLFIDGVDINDWRLVALRRQIGVATQEPFLFSDTITGNLRFGNAAASPDDVTRAAEIAALTKDIVDFPAGYDTMVGERGITLSGGQKQRAAIARALVVDPAILILDDATSAVDTETDDQINRHLHAERRTRTTIIISHRVSSIKEADRILYLDSGRIIEQGTHDELTARGGAYADLYRTQLLARQLEQLA